MHAAVAAWLVITGAAAAQNAMPVSSSPTAFTAPAYTPANAKAPLRSWRLDITDCDPAHARLSVVDANGRVKNSVVIEDLALKCPVDPIYLHGEVTRFADEMAWSSDPHDHSSFEVGSFALSRERRAVAIVTTRGNNSLAYDHAVYVEEDGRIRRVWRAQHGGFLATPSVVEHELAVEPADAAGAEHLLYAVQPRASTTAPMVRKRLGYDAKAKVMREESQPYWLVLAASKKTQAEAQQAASSAALQKCATAPFVGASDVLAQLKPGLFIVAFPAPTKAAADELLATLKPCAADAYAVAVDPRPLWSGSARERASDSLAWRVTLERCKKGVAPVRISLVGADDEKVRDTLVLDDDAAPYCPTAPLPEQESRMMGGVVVAGGNPDDERDKSVLDVGPLALTPTRSGVVLVLAAGGESIGFDHRLFVEEGGKIVKAWAYKHGGFENGVVEDRFEVEHADKSGAEHLLAAWQHLGVTAPPLEHVRITYDIAKKVVVTKPLSSFLVVTGTYDGASDADAAAATRQKAIEKCGSGAMFEMNADTNFLRGFTHGVFVTGFAEAKKADADKRLAEIKPCLADAYVREVPPS